MAHFQPAESAGFFNGKWAEMKYGHLLNSDRNGESIYPFKSPFIEIG
jgi:hypothetical protein